MKRIFKIWLSVIFVLAMGSMSLYGQQKTGSNFKKQFNQHFKYASRVLSLAKEIPADKYSWRPGEEVYSVERVYTHIAYYNFCYLQKSLGIPAPKDVNVEKIESITGKEKVVAILERSIKHVQKEVKQMPNSKLSKTTELYGRKVNGQAVLVQLITHMSEHVGQSIAYARVNGIVPPWSK